MKQKLKNLSNLVTQTVSSEDTIEDRLIWLQYSWGFYHILHLFTTMFIYLSGDKYKDNLAENVWTMN